MASRLEFNVERLTVSGSLADRVCEALTQLIRGDDFPPGSRLPSEMNMANRFGVSRTVITAIRRGELYRDVGATNIWSQLLRKSA